MKTLLLAAAVLLAAPAADAAEYQLLIHEHPAELAKRTDPGPAGQAYWKAYADFGARLQQAGVLRGGAALAPAVLSSRGNGAPAPSLGGWFVIEAPDAATAARWAAEVPAAQSGGRVELRALYPVPGMNAAR
jgi:hypothetical protein